MATPSPSAEPVAIIGIGCRFPGGARTPDAFWKLLCAGTDAVSEITPDRWCLKRYFHPEPGKPGKTYSKWAGLIDGIDQFDAHFFGLSPREAAAMDPQQRLLLETVWEAMEDAGQPIDLARGSGTGVFVGISTTDYELIQTSGSGFERLDGYSATGTAMSLAANRISYCFNFHGPSQPVDTACSSSLMAVHQAVSALRNGECAMAIAAGVNVIAGVSPFIAFSSMSMLSPQGRCKAFDASADGFVRGEGVGAILLKPLSAALAAGDRIHSVIRATAANQDGRTPGITVPNQQAQENLVLQACEAAGIAPATVRYVEAHGTGTPVGDPIEANALGMALGQGRKADNPCWIGSVKTNIGHLEAAAGMAGIIKTALVLKHGLIPPNLHFREPSPRIDFDKLKLRIPLQPTPLRRGTAPLLACVNAFGWGGANAHALLEAPPPRKTSRPRAGKRVWLLPISARSPEALAASAQAHADFLRQRNAPPLPDICHTAALRRGHLEYRASCTGATKQELARQLDELAQGDSRQQLEQPPSRAKVAFIFSGQGPQWWRMGRDLLEREPVFRAKMEECDALLRKVAGWSLLEELTASESASRLHDTSRAQPAICALQTALAALWRSWGVEPAAVAGHSVGEVAAAHLAGVLDLRQAMAVIFHRGDTMRHARDDGRMLAAGLSEPDALKLIAADPDRLFLAAVNSPSSVTLSGEAAALVSVAAELEQRQVFARFVPVNHAFHSAHMDSLQTGLLHALQDLRPNDAALPIASTVTGRLATGKTFNAAYWWNNVRGTVRFADAVKTLTEQGCRTFIEISPHPVLSQSLRECLADQEESCNVLASLRRGSDDQAALLTSLGRLHTLGYPLRWEKVLPGGGQAVRLPPYPWQRQRYWSEPEASRALRLDASPHPLLERRVDCADPCWQVRLDRRLFPYLSDHRIQGRALMPAAGFLEIALAAARARFGPGGYSLENVDFLNALFLPDGERWPLLQIAFQPADFSFAISSRGHAGNGVWTTHVTGKARLSVETATGEEPARLDAARSRCDTVIPQAILYQMFYEAGAQFGPAFRCVKELHRRDREVLAHIGFPQPIASEAAAYLFHPAFLDACIHAGFLAAPLEIHSGKRGVFLPVRVERVQYFSSPQSDCWLHGEIGQYGPRACSGDFRLMDADNRLCMQLSGLRWQMVEGTDNELDGLLFDLQWQAQPLAGATAVGAAFDFPHDLAELARRLEQKRPPGRGEPIKTPRAADGFLNALTADHILRAFAALGWRPRTGERIGAEDLRERLALPLSALPLLRRLLRHMESAGILRKARSQSAWTVGGPPKPIEAGEIWHKVLALAPALAPALILTDNAGHQLERLLRGGSDAQAVLFPGGSSNLFEQLCADAPCFRLPHRLIADAVAEAAAGLKEGRTLRLLEIGAGTGGATEGILPRLQADRTRYLYTDNRDTHFAEARRRFQDYPFVHYRILDLGQDPSQQGLEADHADIALSAQAFSEDPGRALIRLKTLLAPGGLLALSGLRRPPLWLDFLLGLLHPSHSFPTGTALRRRAQTAGFTDTALIEADGHFLLLARKPGEIPAAALAAGELPVVATPQSWLILADREGVGAKLAEQLRQRGDHCRLLRQTEWRDDPAALQQAWAELEAHSGNRAIVHLWSLDAPSSDEPNSKEIELAQSPGCLSVLHLLQTVGNTAANPPTLWLVTRGAQAAGERPHPIAMAQTPLIGLGRVIRSEYPNLPCYCLDLDPAQPANDSDALLGELLQGGGEDEIAWRGTTRYVQRIGHGSWRAARRGAAPWVDAREHPCRLETSKPGLLERLTFTPLTRREPGPDEVEIEVSAAGLNFRDVMKALGIYPSDAGDAAILGDECSGRIAAVGRDVKGLKAGDEVMAIAPGCLASHVTLHAALALPKPPRLNHEEAATMLVAYLTAYYALHQLAHLRQGERVLIHSAAGGVGYAAVRLAQRAGAEIFATAGNEEKREFLRHCGVKYVMDSRSLAFADQARQYTGGAGVDVVLNSLAGEFIPRSLALLREGGRFLEIGKRDIYQDSKLGLRPFRNNLSFFAVDLGRAMQPAFIEKHTAELARQFKQGLLPALPYRVFPLSRAPDAFRYMAQARQIGKIVLSVRGEPIPRPEPPQANRVEFHPHGSYLITGGLSGFGLATAQWMVLRGARHLLLMGRSGIGKEAEQALRQMRNAGAEVIIAQGDVSQENDVKRVLDAIGKDHPPLRGIIHAAAVIDDGMLAQLDTGRFRKVMAPKMAGAWHLHRLTRHLPLDCFVLFSSIAAVTGNPGQGNYAAANAFLDALAHHRHALGLPAISINWDYLNDVGYAARSPKLQEHFSRLGWKGLSAATALQAMERLLASSIPQIAVSRLDWSALARRAPRSLRYSLLADEPGDGGEQRSDAAWIRDAVMNAPPEEGLRIIETYLRKQIAKLLRLPSAKIKSNRPLVELGLDSLMAVELVSRIEAMLGTSVPIGQLSGGPSIDKIAVLLWETLTGTRAGAAVEKPASANAGAAKLAAEAVIDPSIRFADLPPDPARTASPQAVFLTGASQFCGAFLLHELLEKTQARVVCLVTEPNAEDGLRHIETVMAKYGLSVDPSRIEAVAGTLAAPKLGLPDSLFEALAARIDAIYHTAAHAHHLLPYARLKADNVDSAQAILRLASLGRLKPLHYLSSVSVLMAASDESSRVREDDPLPNPERLGSGYAQTRWVAEKIFEQARAKGLPVNIYRPGLTIGDSRGGASESEDAFWRLMKGCIERGAGPDLASNTFLTPVDYVSAGLVALSLRPRLAGRTFHLVNPRACPFADVLKAARRFGYALDVLPRQDWSGKAAVPEAYRLLIPDELLDPFHNNRYKTRLQADCGQAIAGLVPSATACPPVDDAMLWRCFDYLVRRGFLPPPVAGKKT